MFNKLYKKLIQQAAHPKAPWLLGTISFAESSVSPIPPDPLMIPMIIANPQKAWFLSTLCTATSVLGGILGYLIGYFLFETLGLYVLNFYNLMDAFHTFQEWFNKWGFWIIVIKGLTPIPYKVVTITSGATKLDFLTFVLASTLSRGTRFFIEGALVWKYGEKIHRIIDRHTTVLTLSFIAILVAGFYIVKHCVSC